MNKRLALIFLVVGVLIVVGCVENNGKTNQTTAENQTKDIKPSSNVTIAPKQFFMKPGQSEHFNYWNHEIVINYTKDAEMHLIEVIVDGKTTLIRKNASGYPRGEYRSIDDLHFSVKPVVWEERDGRKVPVFEKTWNVSEIYVGIIKR